ncbi:MAG: hypothetical protein GY913_18610 [Proteobacteria bacterium]|nr:hypothetical protein [Pseudomonadota bacterium]
MRRPLPIVLLALLVPTVWAATGGPDSGGIEYITSEETDGPPHVALDIDDEGDLLASSGDTGLVELPFEVDWYGSDEDTLHVGDNGTAFFQGDQASTSASCPAGGSWSGVAAYWDDLTGATVRGATLGRYPNRLVVLDWQDFSPGSATGTGQVQVWFQEATDQVVVVHEDIDFGDKAYDGGVGAVIGVQGSSTAGLEWSCSGGLSDEVSGWFSEPEARAGAPEVQLYTTGWYWYGADDDVYLAGAVDGADINGDGYSDVAMGAAEGDAVWLVFGGSSPSSGDTDSATAVFEGDSGDETGAGVALADLDGDGLVDVAIGAPRADDAAVDAGAVHVFANAAFSGSIDAPVDRDMVLTGSASSSKPKAGTAVMSPGDIDGDGVDDLLVGAPGDDAAYTNAGAVHIWYGGTISGTVDLAGEAAIEGETAGDSLGEALSGADADGDGQADIAIGSRLSDSAATDAGRGYLVLGDAYTGSNDIATVAAADVVGDSSLDYLGTSILLADVDGDGFADLFLGAPRDDGGGSDAGVVYVFEDGSSLSGSYAAADADGIIEGDDSHQKVGSGLAAGDLDGDATVDLVVGGEGAQSSAGAAWVFRGLPSSSTADVGDADHALLGSYSAGGVGIALTVLADHDGDGLGEVVAPGATSSVSSGTLNGIVSIWPYAPSWLDDDGDGLVAVASDGPDCDDDNADAYPGNDEDTGLDTGDFTIDNDCDGWHDGAYALRLDDELWAWDTDDILGTTTVETFDFEDATSAADLSTHYSSNGLEFTASGSVVAASPVHGADPKGTLGAKVVTGSTENALLLTFDDDVDALSFQLLDSEDSVRLQAYTADTSDLLTSRGSLRIDHDGQDLAGGRFVGVVFSEPVRYVRIEGTFDDAWGLDDIGVVWATESDRDGDGYSGADGDCDDGNADVNPGETEDVSNGVDDDCDDVVDGGTSETYTDEPTWETDAGITVEEIDFEDLTAGDLVDDDYTELGILMNEDIEVVTDVDGAGANDTQAGQADASVVTLDFEEKQTAVAFDLFDGVGTFTFDGYYGSVHMYADTLTVSEDDTSSFRGFVYEYGIDSLVITGPTGDDWGLDDVRLSELGLDDGDGDGYTESEGDCDDANADAYPGNTETYYDGVDGDCDGESDYDADGDGWDLGDDCDDGDATQSPDAEETYYDGVDQDCDGASDYDADGDGYDSDVYGGDDCDDEDADKYPGAAETYYDGEDENCDDTDEYDADGDGYSWDGDGEWEEGEDCDDVDADTYPGADETDYDGVDSDCDGESDYDADGDGYDSEDYGGTDCDDHNASAYPGATDAWYDGVDNDCAGDSDYDQDVDGYDSDLYGGLDCDDEDASISPDATESDDDDGIDEDCDGVDEWDDDSDGYRTTDHGGLDCDDDDAAIHPGATEVCYDGVDQDCDEASDYDCDLDGWDSDAYGGADCDDADGTIRPDATDYWYDDVDHDCDGADDFDQDADGYQVTWYGGDDCDDTDASVNIGATDTWYDGVDQDCDGASDYDADGDGHDSDVYGGDDCDDTDATLCPTCVETSYDGIDQDCDGGDAVDADGDGYADAAMGGDDCDDADPTIHPGAEEAWYDGVDQDCDELSDYDQDGDGHDAEEWDGDDCDDTDPETYWDAPERWYDGIDQDCLGGDDYDQDGDGHLASGWGGDDCDDTSATVSPSATEVDCNRVDDDCDGAIDEDALCEDTGDSAPPEDTEEDSEPVDSEPAIEDTGPRYIGFPEGYREDTVDEGCGGCGGELALGPWVLGLVLITRRRKDIAPKVDSGPR